MAKASAKVRKASKTKRELLDAAIAEAVGAGKERHLESVNFSDPQRPKTCLEVDFPILPINRVAVIEGNAGKPIYQMSKWWARRRSSVFRAMLIAAATKAPDDPSEAARLVWDSYYGKHQNNEAFSKLKVADIFMGGGTTIVEGCRLGMQMFGNDLNPVAWLVVKNEVADVALTEVEKLLNCVESQVKPQIMPFYACDCPRGHKGRWTQRSSGTVMCDGFDPMQLAPDMRSDFVYEGPEVIHTFWSKHGPCRATGCGHRTPIMQSPAFAEKTLTVKAWKSLKCASCDTAFDVEERDARMAPSALFVVSGSEAPYTVRNADGSCTCPRCGYQMYPPPTKPMSKSVQLTLFVHPDWLKGSPQRADDGTEYGGSITDSLAATTAWNVTRSKSLKLIEVRGVLPSEVRCPDTDEVFFTDRRGGTVPMQATFACMAPTCGLKQDIVVSIQKTKKSGPTSAFANQGFCPTCQAQGDPYGGRFFDTPRPAVINGAIANWNQQCFGDLKGYWPDVEIPHGYMSPIQNDLPAHGFPRFCDLYNPRQLYVHAHLLRAIATAGVCSFEVRDYVFGAFQQYLKNQCMLAFWHRSHDHFAPALSERNYHPKTTSVEVGVFSPVGYGPWTSTVGSLRDGGVWRESPWELVATDAIADASPHLVAGVSSKSLKVFPGDPVAGRPRLACQSSSKLTELADEEFDLVVTDPPFGGLIHYSELSDFFYVWLRLVLKDRYPELFTSLFAPKALEAVANKSRNPDDCDEFYQRLLTECWREAKRILKPGGLLAFTFHHSEDEPWVAVLESLFDAGFYLEATYPIRSDETKGEGQFGSKQIEFDIIHVCRKRIDDPKEISWARLRRQILQDVQQLQLILEHHQKAGLQQADLQVIRRGKALEYFSKHYGKVYIEKGREFTVREALAGINQLLDDQQDAKADVPPVDAEPYTRQFLRLFADTTAVPRDQMQKYLRGTGISPTAFEERGWCKEVKKVFHLASPLAFAQQWKGKPRQGMGRDFDQAFFLIGGCVENSGIRVHDTLNSDRFEPHVATGLILEWFTHHGGDTQTRDAAKIARQIYSNWEASNDTKVKAAQRTFDFLEGD